MNAFPTAGKARITAIAATLCTVAIVTALPVRAQAAGADSPSELSVGRHQTVAQRLSLLQAQLKLTSEQESLWQSYASAVTDQAAARKAYRASNPPSETLTLPERIDRRNAMIQQLAPSQQAVDAATKQLYAALSANQQLTFELAAAHAKGRHGGGWAGQ